MCKHMSGEEGLMEHMEWENHLTKDGMMSVTVVGHGYEEAFGRAMANMEATGGKMMAGEKMYLCGFCQSYGGLMMAGANFENFETGSRPHQPGLLARPGRDQEDPRPRPAHHRRVRQDGRRRGRGS